jgi:hypothetical protein
MSKSRPRPMPDPGSNLPHDDARDARQPYAAEHDDYASGVAKPPEQQTGKTPADSKSRKRPR